ncbi:IstB-like ATP binding protein [Niabella drilacis]|uniref:IstB-like ATP binding protein n=1 Tax=Niabella drilacis (strain DSM 25811 / CCM 8410 / CCUG 62505 / LMG 26954 / E90) TaxID=1285928 RepID=A0A1G6LGI5_NIADE|nr:IstB-like ATP binding protein [Niabella drilacis]
MAVWHSHKKCSHLKSAKHTQKKVPETLIRTATGGCAAAMLWCGDAGHRAFYFAMNRFVEALTAARLDGSYIKLLNQLSKTPLWIFDDFGPPPLTYDMRMTLLQIPEDRYANGSTTVTSQLPVLPASATTSNYSFAISSCFVFCTTYRRTRRSTSILIASPW